MNEVEATAQNKFVIKALVKVCSKQRNNNHLQQPLVIYDDIMTTKIDINSFHFIETLRTNVNNKMCNKNNVNCGIYCRFSNIGNNKNDIMNKFMFNIYWLTFS